MTDKVRSQHVDRKALVYIRQSSTFQVEHYVESQRLQYAMEQRLRSLGWSDVEVIDEDLGRSGTSTADRTGFQRLVSEVGLGKVGAVAAREVSRFCRNNRDWHQLVEMCGLVDTLLIDHEAVYDARHGNDRLLLGLKGSLSEYELDLLRQRSLEARWAKARRGELILAPPAGFIKTRDGRFEKSPDARVQHAVHLVFDKFFELGSARQVLMWFIEEGLQVPVSRHGPDGWTAKWRRPTYRNVHRILTDPTYAGAYAYGRIQRRKELRGGVVVNRSSRVALEDWPVLIRDHHEGYIPWEKFERIRAMMADNNVQFAPARPGAAKRGPALLPGLLRCRRCGRKLLVCYSGRNASVPRYTCCRGRLDAGDPKCIAVGGITVDETVAQEMLRVVQPAAVEAAISAGNEATGQQDAVIDTLLLELKAAQFESERAWRQYDAVDPGNRLVADELERRWNSALLKERELQHRIEHEQANRQQSSMPTRDELGQLGSDLGSVWNDPETDVRLKKRIIRALIQEIVLDIDEEQHEVVLIIHWKGGVHSEHRMARQRRGKSRGHTNQDIVDAVRSLVRICNDEQIASWLNRNGLLTGRKNRWARERVTALRSKRKIEKYSDERKRREGWLTLTEAAKVVGVSSLTLRRAIERGEVEADHPLASGPWILRRANIDAPRTRRLFAHLVDGSASPGKPSSDQLHLTIPTT